MMKEEEGRREKGEREGGLGRARGLGKYMTD